MKLSITTLVSDTQHNGTQHNGTQQNGTQHKANKRITHICEPNVQKDGLYNVAQKYHSQHNDVKQYNTQYNDTQHTDSQRLKILRYKSQLQPLGFVSLY